MRFFDLSVPLDRNPCSIGWDRLLEPEKEKASKKAPVAVSDIEPTSVEEVYFPSVLLSSEASFLKVDFSTFFSKERLETIKNTTNVVSGVFAILTACYFLLATGNFVLSAFQITGLETLPFVLKGTLSFFLFGTSTHLEKILQKEISSKEQKARKKDNLEKDNKPHFASCGWTIKAPDYSGSITFEKEEDNAEDNTVVSKVRYPRPSGLLGWLTSIGNTTSKGPGIGLNNIESCCYANAVFQLLRPHLVPRLQEVRLPQEMQEEHSDIASLIDFYEEYKRLASEEVGSILRTKPSWFTSFVESRDGGMQDAGEFCAFLLSELCESLERLGVDSGWFSFGSISNLKLHPNGRTVISRSTKPENILNLPLCKLEGEVPLSEMIQQYSKEEKIEYQYFWNRNGIICEKQPHHENKIEAKNQKKPKNKIRAKNQKKPKRKIRAKDRHSKIAEKTMALQIFEGKPLVVRFTRELYVPKREAIVKSRAKITEAFSLSIGGVQKHLQGFIIHSGFGVNYGHYVAYVKDPNDEGKWKSYDDGRVEYVEEEETKEKSQDMVMAVYL